MASKHLLLDVYDAKRPVAYTQTTYYDSADRRYWRDEEQGLSRRVRLRQYAAAELPETTPCLVGPAYLEYKESTGSERRKLRHESDPTQLRSVLDAGQMDSDEECRLQESPTLFELAMAIRDGELSPVFSTWYRRVSLSKQGVRLTIDENVSFCPPLAIGVAGDAVNPKVKLDLISGRIIELKIKGETPPWLAAAMDGLSGTETPSKFRRGMQVLGSSRQGSLSGTRPLTILAPIRTRRSS